MLRSMLGETIGGATVLELVLALATRYALYTLAGSISNRMLFDGGAFMTPARMWLGAPLATFLVCAILLAGAMHLRVRLLGGIEYEEERAGS